MLQKQRTLPEFTTMCGFLTVVVVLWGLYSPFSFFCVPLVFFFIFQCTCWVCEHVFNCGWGCVVGLVITCFLFCAPLVCFFLCTCRVCEHVLNCGWGCVLGLVLTLFCVFPWSFFFQCTCRVCEHVVNCGWGCRGACTHLFPFFCFLVFFGHVLTCGGGLFLLVMYSLVYCLYLLHMNLIQSLPSTATTL